MPSLTVSIPEAMRAFVESEMAEAGYASPSEYVNVLIAEAQRRRARRELEAKFREAEEGGPAEPMTPEAWASLRRQALDGLAGEAILP
ncbi:ribbon-helix-helix domain-containing protein [Tundrisphaera sp. TA3]|uniref:ribbon-helix-helix domain-containing protein n=1 Tax=Tundrisphaera sp. TA3 TaxID=3435775 RepID=UPI003EB906AE